jgi:hypothetical protein
MAYLLVHYRFRRNNAPLTDSAKHYRPGDIQEVFDSVDGFGEAIEEYLVLEIPGTAAEWAHLGSPRWKKYADSRFEDDIVSIRRFAVDLTKVLTLQQRIRLAARKTKSEARRAAYAQLSRATGNLQKARAGARQAAIAAFPAVVADLDSLDTELVALREDPVTISETDLIDRGEDITNAVVAIG